MFPIILLPILAVGGIVAYLVARKDGVLPGYQAITRTAANGVPVTVQVPVATGNAAPPIVTTPTGTASLSVQSVEDAQRALNALNFGPVSVDGNASNPSMSDAVTRFELSQGYRMVRGQLTAPIMGALQTTLSALAQPAAIIANHPTVVGATDATPVAVSSPKDIQHALNLLGSVPPLTEDGNLGPMSKAAIKAFQQSHGLTADGIAGPQTQAALTLALRGLTSTMSGDPMPAPPEGGHHTRAKKHGHHHYHEGARRPPPPKTAA